MPFRLATGRVAANRNKRPSSQNELDPIAGMQLQSNTYRLRGADLSSESHRGGHVSYHACLFHRNERWRWQSIFADVALEIFAGDWLLTTPDTRGIRIDG